jgi:hypothetical protein
VTVRTWFTISALALIAMSLAAYYRLTTPAPPPEIFARAGAARIVGARQAVCWPRRGGKIGCERRSALEPRIVNISPDARIQLSAFPVEPLQATIAIDSVKPGTNIRLNQWKRTLPRLHPGGYRLRVHAVYTKRTFVDYVFALRVTRSGS